jgi:deoxyinosine 3'endonuclease (endonuclease V)
MDTSRDPACGLVAAMDVHYLRSGEARAVAVVAADAAFCHVVAERTAVVREVAPYRPGEFFRRELPPLRAVLRGIGGLGLLVIDGYADPDPDGRPGLGAHAHAEFGIPVIGVAKSPLGTHALGCGDLESLWPEAQSVPSASLVPCIRSPLAGWTVAEVAINDGQSVVTLNHDRTGPSTVVLRLTAACDPAGAVQAPSPAPGGPPLPAGRAAHRRVQGDLVRPVPGWLPDLPTALHQRRRGVVHRRPARAARVRDP